MPWKYYVTLYITIIGYKALGILSIKQKSGETRYINKGNLFVIKNIFVKTHLTDIKLKAGEDRELSWTIQKLAYKTE